ncbi:FAD-dependent oxidoreductase [Sediminibacillus dalangtanensis]|uniref:FAD-dependent oxidoreductase n=1 Tax=Sediminibacillus dalangtanensis TaxID=2729421 RepID=A0ABX7VPU1_9BACI|nr:FAD-binding oxidoreductase [Sediminibacillus dalangtanensis]QTM97974.1 FAD-dependent oxidoreductase [Sediminibacillus dalangtanensis]
MKKFIIVGAGILGASTAYRLAKAGAEVMIVDRKDTGQATDAAAGIICPWLSQRRNKAWYQLAKGGARYYPELIKELTSDGEKNTGYTKSGAISLHHDQKKLDAMEERAWKRRESAPEMGEISRLSADQAKALFPPLSGEMEAVHVSGAARVDGRLLLNALLRAAAKHGAERINGSASLAVKGNKAYGVRVDKEVFYADKVIVTAGAWAQELFNQAGIPFNVRFQKAQILHLELPDTQTADWPVVMPPSNHYLLAFDPNRIVVGTTHEDIEHYDTRATAGGIKEILDKSLQTAPGLSESTLLEARVGFRPFTPGFLPVIGAVPGFEGLLTANGLGASGLTMGPYIGSELAKLALGETTEIDLNLYDVAGALT